MKKWLDFSQNVKKTRTKAVERFLEVYGISREIWDSMKWDDWHKIPVFVAMDLIPLGGGMRFVGSELEEITYSFRHRRKGKLLGATMEVVENLRWTGSVLSCKGDADDAARAAITSFIELAYLRSTQEDFSL